MYRGSNMKTYISKDRQWECAVGLRELTLGLCDKLEGWHEVGCGREAPEGGDLCISIADSGQTIQYDSNPSLCPNH